MTDAERRALLVLRPCTLVGDERDARLDLLMAKIAEAEAAYQRLQNGTSVRVVVDPGGDRVEFSAANSDKLGKYITSLRLELAALLGVPEVEVNPQITHPIGFTF